jgi:putative heme-binding domain-containing protein
VRASLILSALPLLLFLPPSLPAQEHVGQYSQADIDRGFRLYANNCALCHGPNGDSIANVDLRSGRFRHAANDQDLGRVILAGIPGTAMPPHKLDSGDVNGLVAYIRSLRGQSARAVTAGDAARGRALVSGKGACLTCHRIADQGARFAPDLTDIGAVRQPAALQGSLVDPTASMRPFNRTVRAVNRDGKVIEGRRLNENMYSVQLIDRNDRLVSLIKADLKEYSVSNVSAMPSYRDKLAPQELADVVAYLGTLKGIQ